MDLRLLEIFCRVYKERSFSRAAMELGLSQPTVSIHIRDLEEALGTPVFNRLGREIEPTEAGRFLYEHASPLVSLKRNLSEKMAGFLNRVEGQLVVGASSVPGDCLLPRILMDFRARYPAVQARLRISDTAETLEALRHGDIELGVVGATVQDDDLLYESFATDELLLVTPADGAWKQRSEVSLAELKETPFVLREAGSGTRTSLERALAARKVQLSDLNIAAELGSTAAIKEAVKQGRAVAFMSKLTVDAEVQAGTLRVANVPELGRIARTYYVVFSRKRVLSPLTRAFLDYLRQFSTVRPQPQSPAKRRSRSKSASR